MPQYHDIFYHNPFVEAPQAVDTVQVADTIVSDSVACDSVVPSFITSGFNGTLIPMPRMTYEILQGWNLALLGLMLLRVLLLNFQVHLSRTNLSGYILSLRFLAHND